jgi:cation transport regulator ChaC
MPNQRPIVGAGLFIARRASSTRAEVTIGVAYYIPASTSAEPTREANRRAVTGVTRA